MNVRRVVAGTQNGKAVFLADGQAPQSHKYTHIPGFATALIWQTGQAPSIAEGFADPVTASSSLLPQVGESKCLMVSFPPDSVFLSSDFDPESAIAEQQRYLLGLFDCFDPEHPGKHATPTIDFGIVVKGPVVLELDDGEQRELGSGDVIIQQGNAHAWRNPGSEPAQVLFVLIGAHTAK